jgi:protein TonB
MKTHKDLKYQKIFKIFLVVPIVLIMLLAVSSCSKSKKTEPALPEVAPPPPPPTVPLNSASDSVYRVVDLLPVFPGGDAALLKLIGDSIKYPEAAKSKGIQGKVIVQFVIYPDGKAGSAKILKGADPLLDTEALSVIQKLPKFEPGFKDGKAVPVYFMVPIYFNLN